VTVEGVKVERGEKEVVGRNSLCSRHTIEFILNGE